MPGKSIFATVKQPREMEVRNRGLRILSLPPNPACGSGSGSEEPPHISGLQFLHPYPRDAIHLPREHSVAPSVLHHLFTHIGKPA